MALQDFPGLIVEVDTASSLPDPSTVSGREHIIVNQSLVPVLLTSSGIGTPFSIGTIPATNFSLLPGVPYSFQSDGTRWTLRNGTASRAFFAGTAVTDASGNATFTFPAGLFSAPPIIDTATQFPASSNPIDTRITTLTATSCVINAKQSPTLVVLSLSVLGVAANIAGVTIHCIATPSGITP